MPPDFTYPFKTLRYLSPDSGSDLLAALLESLQWFMQLSRLLQWG